MKATFVRNWTERDDAKLMIDLNQAIGNQIVDVNKLADVLREKDHYGNDQVKAMISLTK